MSKVEAKINWRWLETKEGMDFLERLNGEIKEISLFTKTITCSDIDCPFNCKCETNCTKAFITELENPCPCYEYESPIDLAIILSDYYDMVKDEKI